MPRFNLDDYVTVQERIVQFWKDHPDGAIRTQLESPSDNFDTCRYSAAVFTHREHAHPDATGWAFEKAGGGGPNATSHEENGETSAIGRALANLGYATSQKDRPSREEMAKVQRQQPEPPPRPQQTGPRELASAAQRNLIIGHWKDLGYTVTGEDGKTHHDSEGLERALRQKFEDDTLSLARLSKQQATETIEGLKKKLAEREKQVSNG